jgi:hypothetical protein
LRRIRYKPIREFYAEVETILDNNMNEGYQNSKVTQKRGKKQQADNRSTLNPEITTEISTPLERLVIPQSVLDINNIESLPPRISENTSNINESDFSASNTFDQTKTPDKMILTEPELSNSSPGGLNSQPPKTSAEDTLIKTMSVPPKDQTSSSGSGPPGSFIISTTTPDRSSDVAGKQFQSKNKDPHTHSRTRTNNSDLFSGTEMVTSEHSHLLQPRCASASYNKENTKTNDKEAPSQSRNGKQQPREFVVKHIWGLPKHTIHVLESAVPEEGSPTLAAINQSNEPPNY